MTDTSPSAASSTSRPDHPRRRFLRRAALGTLVASVAAGLGLAAFAEGGLRGWHRGGLMGASLDPARLDEHLGRMLKHVYVEIDATEAQKQALEPLVKAAAHDLLPVHARMREVRRQAMDLLAQETVDRAALETLRAEQLALAEQGSKRLTQALADLADVLTPAQRKQLAERIGRRHWHRG